MTDDEIRDIFAELRRIGVDLAQPPGLALGTGFRDGEFVAWLRRLPDNVGHASFVEQLDSLVDSAAPVPEPNDETATSGRAHPSQEQLDAGIELLRREWDPLGARLGELSAEDLADHVFDLLAGIHMWPAHGRVDDGVARMIGSLEAHVFGVRRSPLNQRRYLARRLRQVIVDHPAPGGVLGLGLAEPSDSFAQANARASARSGGSRSFGPSRKTVRLGPRPDDPEPLAPDAHCSECGTIGTVAVVAREVEPAISRYCADCWRRVRSRYYEHFPPDMDTETAVGKIRFFDRLDWLMREQPRYSASALWEDALPFMRMSEVADARETPAEQAKHLAFLAREILERAPKMYGPMPPEIEAFVQRHAPPDA